MTVAGLLLAAGAGRRYGMPKALVRMGGRLLVERAAETLRAGGCEPVVVVLGAAADRVRAEASLGDAIVVENPEWPTGMGSSLGSGLRATLELGVQAALVLLVDLPGVTPAAVRRVAALASPDALVMAGYGPRRGHPVLLGREHWAGVAAVAIGDVGARPYLSAHSAAVRVVPCEDVADDRDVDTPEEHTGSHA
ncbi:nucleotidyltransferase family protein [Phytohabitans flavus]|uniref:4-diphosphocytidyl-2C-methyl-D-erythritol synthase n=1 Tax=Phytohabitans flavus TaxID=1076124 RepID=A0A6F8XY93_9ACTN|nr:nucleotidyltransferase family protein [Phytohabitans flavus]BCB78698.1 4-diphosphocytidyl-2C-methyl-D-erythritol synthase [Phytohabitans flavus]